MAMRLSIPWTRFVLSKQSRQFVLNTPSCCSSTESGSLVLLLGLERLRLLCIKKYPKASADGPMMRLILLAASYPPLVSAWKSYSVDFRSDGSLSAPRLSPLDDKSERLIWCLNLDDSSTSPPLVSESRLMT